MQQNYIHTIVKNNEVHYWTRDEQHNLHYKTRDVKDYCYLFKRANGMENQPQYWDIFGNPMKKVYFQDTYSLKSYAEGRDNLCESDIPVPYKFLHDEFKDANPDLPVHIGFYDIEVNVDLSQGKGYANPDHPFEPVTAISLFDNALERYKLFINEQYLNQNLQTIEDDHYPVDMIYCVNEKKLYEKFVSHIEDIDVLTAWNGEVFDLPYLLERATRIMGHIKAKKLFCRNGFEASRRIVFNSKFNEEQIKWSLVGRVHIDMMDIYKKFTMINKPSYALDNICEEELGEQKIEYEGDLGKLLVNDPQKYFEYALHDVRLLWKLEQKLSHLNLCLHMARDSCVFPVDAIGTVKITEQDFLKFVRDQHSIVLPDKEDKEKEKFEGALVYDTLSGQHGWLMTIDLSALYPSVVRSIGISNETFLMQLEKRKEDFIKVKTRSSETVRIFMKYEDEVFDLPAWEMDDIIKENGFTISANGSVFNGKLGLVGEYLTMLATEREQYKAYKKQCEEEGDEEGKRVNDFLQLVIKLRGNSFYGAITNQWFRMFDLDMGKSITLTGQEISKFQAYYGNELLKEC